MTYNCSARYYTICNDQLFFSMIEINKYVVFAKKQKKIITVINAKTNLYYNVNEYSFCTYKRRLECVYKLA